MVRGEDVDVRAIHRQTHCHGGMLKDRCRHSSMCAALDEVYTAEETEFLKAVRRYKTETGDLFPTWMTVLAIVRALGWKPPE